MLQNLGCNPKPYILFGIEGVECEMNMTWVFQNHCYRTTNGLRYLGLRFGVFHSMIPTQSLLASPILPF